MQKIVFIIFASIISSSSFGADSLSNIYNKLEAEKIEKQQTLEKSTTDFSNNYLENMIKITEENIKESISYNKKYTPKYIQPIKKNIFPKNVKANSTYLVCDANQTLIFHHDITNNYLYQVNFIEFYSTKIFNEFKIINFKETMKWTYDNYNYELTKSLNSTYELYFQQINRDVSKSNCREVSLQNTYEKTYEFYTSKYPFSFCEYRPLRFQPSSTREMLASQNSLIGPRTPPSELRKIDALEKKLNSSISKVKVTLGKNGRVDAVETVESSGDPQVDTLHRLQATTLECLVERGVKDIMQFKTNISELKN